MVVATTATVLALSKAAWKLASSLSKLDQDTNIVDVTVRNLIEELKSLGNEWDLVYAELEEELDKTKTESPLLCDVDSRVWHCLVAQVEDTSRTMQELELLFNDVRGEESGLAGQIPRQRRLDKSKDQIASIRTQVCRHTENLRITLLVINM